MLGGLATVPLMAPIAQRTGLSQGIDVNSVQPGRPAAAAGLRVSNVVTVIDGQAATSPDQLLALTIIEQAGGKVDLS